MLRSFQALFGKPGVVPAGPDSLTNTKSLRALIEEQRSIHVIYVHGIKAEGPGASKALITFLKSQLSFKEDSPPADSRLNLGPAPVGATYFDQPIYQGNEWANSQPFVRHHRLVRLDGAQVQIDEVNYWPMLFPLKARFLLVPEHDLSGDDKKHLALVQQVDGVFHDCLRPSDLKELAKPIRGGRAALFNRDLKHDILNWGLSDAVVALGPMRAYLNHAMELAFDTARGRGDPDHDSFVVMSESLGSFVVLDAMDTKPAVADVMSRTDYLYFFANQVALLELARLQGLPASVAPTRSGTAVTPPRPSPYRMLVRWGSNGGNTLQSTRPDRLLRSAIRATF